MYYILMQYKFLNIFLDEKDILAQEKSGLNQILIENNSAQIQSIYEFFQNDSDFLCVNGFLGTGKSKIVDYSLSFLSPDAIVLKYSCFESTILDDILLNFYTELKKLSAQKLIFEQRIKTENFVQKINSYFSQIEKPFVIVINSFEMVLAENRSEIIDFLVHLSKYSKVKIIIISKTFQEDIFLSDTKFDKITILALEKKLFEKYLKSEKLKPSSLFLDEFYRHTRGYYFYTALSIIIMRASGLSLNDFLAEFAKSFLTFEKFLKKQVMSLMPTTYKNLFLFLSMLRHPISIELLQTLNIYDCEKIEYMSKNLIINKEGSLIYVKDFFDELLDGFSGTNVSNKIHQYIIELYQTQLPLKPSQRNIILSRATMRKEVEYHSLFLPKRPKISEFSPLDISYLSYAKGLEFDIASDKSKDESENTLINQKATSEAFSIDNQYAIKIESASLKELPFSLTQEEMEMLDDSHSLEIQSPVQNDTDINTTLEELLTKAKYSEENYNFVKAIQFYKKALEFETHQDFDSQLPGLYTKIAKNYQKISDFDNALDYFKKAIEYFTAKNDIVKANYLKLNIAKIYYDSFKFEKTRDILLDILSFSINPPILSVKTYLQLANLDSNLSDFESAYLNYRNAVELSNETMDVETLSELYFKYALVLDDRSEIDLAIDFYTKCINLSQNSSVNRFLSSAYSNIATIYFERVDQQKNVSAAVKNYLKALEIDEAGNNYDGVYYSSSKLAFILRKKYPKEALKYYKKAFDSAKMLNDIFYIASSALAVGDFYYDKKEDEKALKEYLFALNLVKNEFSKDNINKIQIRINDIKFRLGDEVFHSVMKDFDEEESAE